HWHPQRILHHRPSGIQHSMQALRRRLSPIARLAASAACRLVATTRLAFSSPVSKQIWIGRTSAVPKPSIQMSPLLRRAYSPLARRLIGLAPCAVGSVSLL